MQRHKNRGQRLHENEPDQTAFALQPDGEKARRGAAKGSEHRHAPEVRDLTESL
jgi:hypothetical protein